MQKKTRFYLRLSILLVLVGAIIFTIYNTATKDKAQLLKVGDKAPDFALVDMNGKKHQLSEYKGQGVFLNFWGTWCKPCEKEFPLIDKQYQTYKDQGVEVLAINVAEPELSVQKYIDRKSLTFPVLIDHTKSVMRTYNIDPLPTTLLISPEGKIEKIITGQMDESDIKANMEQIKPKKM